MRTYTGILLAVQSFTKYSYAFVYKYNWIKYFLKLKSDFVSFTHTQNKELPLFDYSLPLTRAQQTSSLHRVACSDRLSSASVSWTGTWPPISEIRREMSSTLVYCDVLFHRKESTARKIPHKFTDQMEHFYVTIALLHVVLVNMNIIW